MNILAGLPIGIKIVGGIVTTATAVAVPTAIIINNSNANKPPETPQVHMVQQVKPEEPKEIAVAEETPKSTTEPAKVESVAPVKTEQPAPNPTPAPAPTKEELFAKAVAEFKATAVSGDGKVTGKEFLDKMRAGYLAVFEKEPNTEYARRWLERSYRMDMIITISMKLAKILQDYGLIDADMEFYQKHKTSYTHLIDLAISGNY